MSRNKFNILALVVLAAGMMWSCSMGTLPLEQNNSINPASAGSKQLVAGTWNVTGPWDISCVELAGPEMGGGPWLHHMDLTMAPDGTLSGTGYYIPAPSYTWVIDSGSFISGNNVHILLHFTAGHPTDWTSVWNMTIDDNGKFSGVLNEINDQGWRDSQGNNGNLTSYNGQATRSYTTVLPKVVITSPADGGSYLATALPALAYTVDGAQANADVTGWSTEVGVHTVTVTATDVAGDKGSASVTYEVTAPINDNKIALEIDDMKIDFKKKADDDKLMIQAHINPLELVDLQKTDAFNVEITSGGTVSAGPVTLTVRGHKKGDKWEYTRPRGETSDIQRITFDWNEKKVENLTIRLDRAELGGLTNPGAVTITIQIGRYVGTANVGMTVDKKGNMWKYDPDDKSKKGK